MMKKIFRLALAIAALAIFCSSSRAADRTITITGTGRASSPPEMIVVGLSLATVDQSYESALAGASQKIDKLDAALREKKFPERSLVTTNFSIAAEYQSRRRDDGEHERVFVGWRVSHSLKLSFDFDTDRLSAALGAISSSGADPGLDISFTVSDERAEKLKEAVLADAAANATQRAQTLCGATGVKLGKLTRVDYTFGRATFRSPTRFAVDGAEMKLANAAMPDISPDDVDITESATFTWEIVD